MSKPDLLHLPFYCEETLIADIPKGARVCIPIHLALPKRNLIKVLSKVEALDSTHGKGMVDFTGSQAESLTPSFACV